MAYTLKDKIKVLQDMVERLEVLSELLVEEDIDSSDNALRASKVLNSIREEYKERYKNTYDREYEDE